MQEITGVKNKTKRFIFFILIKVIGKQVSVSTIKHLNVAGSTILLRLWYSTALANPCEIL